MWRLEKLKIKTKTLYKATGGLVFLAVFDPFYQSARVQSPLGYFAGGIYLCLPRVLVNLCSTKQGFLVKTGRVAILIFMFTFYLIYRRPEDLAVGINKATQEMVYILPFFWHPFICLVFLNVRLFEGRHVFQDMLVWVCSPCVWIWHLGVTICPLALFPHSGGGARLPGALCHATSLPDYGLGLLTNRPGPACRIQDCPS